jgi:SAM-dependent methyltransferase
VEVLNASDSLSQESVAPHCATGGGYDPSFFDRLAEVEDRHFWFRARNELILGMARRMSLRLEPCEFVLEIGCGTGNVLRVLEAAFPHSKLVGLELWREGLKHARTRSRAHLVAADIRNSPFRKQFDMVGMFDVLEHIAEDQATLGLVHNALRPGGKLLLTVPAHQWLWSYFDEAACHCRRYSAGGLRHKLETAGFRVEFISQFMACLLPIVWVYRKLNGFKRNAASAQDRSSQEFRLLPVVNSVLTWLLSLEAKWIYRGHSVPLGTSLVVVARKAE